MTETFDTGLQPDSRLSLFNAAAAPDSARFDPFEFMSPGASAQSVQSSEKNLQAPPANHAEIACAPSVDLNQYLEVAARHIYEPKDLGDLKALENKFACNIHTADDLFKYGNTSLAVTGDKYNHVLDPREVDQFHQLQSGGYAGVGLVLTTADELNLKDAPASVYVKSPMAGMPADKAGIKSGDAIVQLDGKDVSKDTVDDVRYLLTRGAPGSKIDVVVNRGGQKVEEMITRAYIDSPPVVHDKDLGDGIVQITIDSFYNGTEAKQLKAIMEKHKDARAFVVDLRGNGGGFVTQAMLSAELFISDGKLMSTRERVDSPPDRPVYTDQIYMLDEKGLHINSKQSDTGATSSDTEDRMPYLANGRPVVILTDQATASASEMFTGAMHDTGHTYVVGTKSFGKGIAQDTYLDQPDGGAIRVTTTHYLTPSGQWPGDAANHKNPLLPDLAVENPAGAVIDTPTDAQLNAATTYLRNKLAAAH